VDSTLKITRDCKHILQRFFYPGATPPYNPSNPVAYSSLFLPVSIRLVCTHFEFVETQGTCSKTVYYYLLWALVKQLAEHMAQS
jgi:hypothetical protein